MRAEGDNMTGLKRQNRAAVLLRLHKNGGLSRKRLAGMLGLTPAAMTKIAAELIEEGLVCEVKALLERGFREGITAPAAIGYKEVVSAIDGDISMDEAIAAIKTATHRYAKRQRTWFRKEKRIRWINADDFDVDSLTEKALSIISQTVCALGA